MGRQTRCLAITFRWVSLERLFCFSAGSALIQDLRWPSCGGGRELAVLAAVNTLLAGAAGGISSMLYMWWFGPTKKPDPGLSVNGILAGLVAITAPCAFVSPLAAVVIGLIAGVLVCFATFGLEKMHIDDPVGAVPVHLCNGAWGCAGGGHLRKRQSCQVQAGMACKLPVPGLIHGGTRRSSPKALNSFPFL